ncbi:right-handed parallel beta-helix repeat-containing protein [Desulfurococcaceae archaeon MEX13E-LK6-19]|nr:right-handed parallel beta-helix repeat-containing protein [Desulfurococcaceae archaeon MEX13E-LK6-19]
MGHRLVLALIIVFTLTIMSCGSLTHILAVGAEVTNTNTQDNIIRVPQDYSTIQEAIDAATPGTIIVVNEGIYYERVRITGKQDITITGNGTVIIDGQNTRDLGVYIINSTSITIKHLVIQNNTGSGIFTWDSQNISIEDSIIQSNGNGVEIWYSRNVSIVECTVQNNTQYGLTVGYSHYVTIVDVVLYNDGLRVLDDYFWDLGATWSTLVVKNTSVNGKPLVYIKNIDLSGKPLNTMHPTVGQILLYNVSNAVISNYSISNTDTGIWLYKVYNITITNITIHDNAENGIRIDLSQNINIINATLENNMQIGTIIQYSRNINIKYSIMWYNSYGVIIDFSRNISLENTTIQNNTMIGAHILHSRNINITSTVIQNNQLGIRTMQLQNMSIVDSVVKGNNREDIHIEYSNSVVVFLCWIGDSVYVYESDVRWFSPTELYYVYNNGLYHGFLGNYWIDYNGTDSNGDGIGDQPYNTSYAIDPYPLIAPPSSYTIIDPEEALHLINNIVVDNTAPIIEILSPANGTIVYEGTLEIKWSIVEPNLDKLILYIDGEPINVTGLTSYSLDAGKLAPGLHNITLYAVDKLGHTTATTIVIQKQAPTTTTTTTSTTPRETETTTTPSKLSPQTIALAMISIALIIAIILVLRRR